MQAISQKMLIQQLRQMESDCMVRRIVHHQVPPKVEYGLTEWGQALCPALDALLQWAAARAVTRALEKEPEDRPAGAAAYVAGVARAAGL